MCVQQDVVDGLMPEGQSQCAGGCGTWVANDEPGVDVLCEGCEGAQEAGRVFVPEIHESR